MNDLAIAAATRVLAENWRGTYTVPAAGLYPHQWSWDSGFIAIGLRHISPRRAQQELDSILSAQWDDGRLPQIVFNPRLDVQYSPGPSFWHSERIPGSPVVPTSGLIQPPNHALAVLLVHEADPETSARRRFLERAYPALRAWHDYLADRRTGASGLVHVVHPWESGMDNSPFWDGPLARIGESYEGDIPRPDLAHADASHRPSNAEYGKYLYLAARYRDHDCDDRDDGYPFVLEDPAVNALFIRSEWAMTRIAELLGEDPQPHRSRARALGESLDSLWDDQLGCYVARDAIAGRHERFRTVSGLLPLLVPELPRTERLLETLHSPHFGLGSAALVPSHDLTAPTFDSARYWRGPSWFNTAWLIAEALYERGYDDAARDLSSQMADLGLGHDFPEYVDPHTGEPRGTMKFSWTAALSLDLFERLHRSGETA
ncbi:MGH1-like glycoside hydrolase domain-containing protein [Micromonospora sp. DT81.3]|uniref:MGH1-like glycoside hydrolase domain-containing protein n=1 Tax=Micromonospora sp. DT81.3 TaxID=3416523 RepID=UPI003CEDDF9C